MRYGSGSPDRCWRDAMVVREVVGAALRAGRRDSGVGEERKASSSAGSVAEGGWSARMLAMVHVTMSGSVVAGWVMGGRRCMIWCMIAKSGG